MNWRRKRRALERRKRVLRLGRRQQRKLQRKMTGRKPHQRMPTPRFCSPNLLELQTSSSPPDRSQNFSAINYAKTVKPKQQATVAYSFIPADAFAGRPIGLTINLNYRDAAGNFFIDPVFNETVQIVEFDEGFDTETFFMYVCIFGASILLLFLAFNFLSGKKGGSRSKPVETGTDDDGVDYEWIPKSALRTPGSGKTSPRQRKAKRGAGSDSE